MNSTRSSNQFSQNAYRKWMASTCLEVTRKKNYQLDDLIENGIFLMGCITRFPGALLLGASGGHGRIRLSVGRHAADCR